MASPPPIARELSEVVQEDQKSVTVTLSHALVHLLSEQLYQSPLKAIEELVVNAYDANATECRVFVPLPSDTEREFIAVYDNGHGMDHTGLIDLWLVGRSKKRDNEMERRTARKQIGKFGIGKLATSTIGNQLTYISKTEQGILGVTIDFTIFKDDDEQQEDIETAEGESIEGKGVEDENNESVEDKAGEQSEHTQPINLPVYEIKEWKKFVVRADIKGVLDALGLDSIDPDTKSWTLAILENLKEKAEAINSGSLHWVLSTAMPLSTDFKLFLNGERVSSSKENYKKVVEFDLTDLPEERLEGLSESTGEEWYVEDDYIKSASFPSGIKGVVFVTEEVLYGKKSDDIQRSHGFFIRVRNRLVDLVDPLFGMTPVRYGTLNRFHAEIHADNLDAHLTASRDAVEESNMKVKFRKLLREVIKEADARYVKTKKEKEEDGSNKEGEKDLVAPRLVEEPIADAMVTQQHDSRGAEASEEWFYLSIPKDVDISQLVQQLYTAPRSKYRYEYKASGRTNRLVKFDPTTSTFWVNTEHELVKEYMGDTNSRRLLEDFVTTEMLLEVYLRENHVCVELIGEMLQKRDDLFRSLAHDRSYSFSMIAQQLRQSAADNYELEINLVVAARALGFNAKHISGPGKPDGIARHIGYPGGIRKITLEAKSSKHSQQRPGGMDFAALRQHADAYKADGCLLVARAYVAQDGDESKVANLARGQRISCWTVEQLAKVIEAAESRHIGAKDILDIVTTAFAPTEVNQAIDGILTEPPLSSRDLYRIIMRILRDSSGGVMDEIRDIRMIIGAISIDPKLKDKVTGDEIRKAFTELSGASKGALIFDRDSGEFYITSDMDELQRRVTDLTKTPTNSRRISSFRD